MSTFRTRRLVRVLVTLGSLLLSGSVHALVILQYHHVSTTTPPSTSITPALFAAHMDYIASTGYRVVSLTDVLAALRAGTTLPDKAVLITFDDAYRSILDTAVPLLTQKKWPYVVFVSTASVASGVDNVMTWAQLRNLAASGASIANHSVSHSYMVRRSGAETDAQWQARMRDEIERAEATIERETGARFRAFAYPYGETSHALQAILKELDFVGFGQHSGAVEGRDQLALPRFPFGGQYGDLQDFALKLKALPLPLSAATLADETGQALADGVLPARVLRPQLTLELPEPALAAAINCYASQQGLVPKRQTLSTRVTFQASAPLPMGRSRYNCTVKSPQPGRFYWYSTPFLRQADDR